QQPRLHVQVGRVVGIEEERDAPVLDRAEVVEEQAREARDRLEHKLDLVLVPDLRDHVVGELRRSGRRGVLRYELEEVTGGRDMTRGAQAALRERSCGQGR